MPIHAFVSMAPTRHNSKCDLIWWACSGHQGGAPWPIRPSGLAPLMVGQRVTWLCCFDILHIWVVLLLVPLVDMVSLDVVLVGVPNKVPRSHAHPILTEVTSLQLRAGGRAPIHITQEPRNMDFLAGDVHPSHQADGIVERLLLNHESSNDSCFASKSWPGSWGAGCHLLGPILISGGHLAPAAVPPPLPTWELRVIY